MRVVIPLCLVFFCLFLLPYEAEAFNLFKKKSTAVTPLTATLSGKPKLDANSHDIRALPYRKKLYKKVPAGASMGIGDQRYFTLGAHLCSANDKIVYGLTNAHNQHTAKTDSDVIQPADYDDDRGHRAVATWTGIINRHSWLDLAVMKFKSGFFGNKKAYVDVGKVLGPNGILLNVKGIVGNDEISTWPLDGTKVLYLSGRMCGWSGVVLLDYAPTFAEVYPDDDSALLSVMTVSDVTSQGSEAWSIETGGNSGSGLWDLDANGKDVRLVGLLNNGVVIPTIENILAEIHSQKGGAGLKVCTI